MIKICGASFDLVRLSKSNMPPYKTRLQHKKEDEKTQKSSPYKGGLKRARRGGKLPSKSPATPGPSASKSPATPRPRTSKSPATPQPSTVTTFSSDDEDLDYLDQVNEENDVQTPKRPRIVSTPAPSTMPVNTQHNAPAAPSTVPVNTQNNAPATANAENGPVLDGQFFFIF